MAKHTLTTLRCGHRKIFESMFGNFSTIRMKVLIDSLQIFFKFSEQPFLRAPMLLRRMLKKWTYHPAEVRQLYFKHDLAVDIE